jgi:hypothetical protein
MKVGEAKQIAKDWVAERAREMPLFAGAFFQGSITRMGDEEEMPPRSDVDVIVMVNRPEWNWLVEAGGELDSDAHLRGGVIIEPLYFAADILRDLERVATSVQLAPTFLAQNIILDPTGILSELQPLVRGSYRKEHRVRQRCQNVEDMTLGWLQSAGPRDAKPPGWATELIFRVCCLYAASYLSSQALCVADLGGITGCKAFMRSREASLKHGLPHLHEKALEIMGCAEITSAQARAHLRELERAYGLACRVVHTPVWGRFYFKEFTRAIAVDAAAEMIVNGSPREGMPFALFLRCIAQNIIENDASLIEKKDLWKGFESLLSAFGLSSPADIETKVERLGDSSPSSMRRRMPSSGATRR